MTTRRTFLAKTLALAAVAPLHGCASAGGDEYASVETKLRSPRVDSSALADFVRLATLAPSGHNTQPWRFHLRSSGVTVRPDFARRTKIVDPDDHHLFVCLGCSAENLLIAANAHGHSAEAVFLAAADPSIEIDFVRGVARTEPLYPAIVTNQSTRSIYDGRTVSSAELRQMEAAARVPGVSVTLLTERAQLEAVLAFIMQGNDLQMANPAFVAELLEWIRFSPEQALASRDGLFTRCSGQPVLPGCIGKRLFDLFFTRTSEDKKYAEHIRSSAGVAVFTGDTADPEHWVKVGRSFQRFSLQATALGIRHSLVNQPVEVASVRDEFARWLGARDARPDLVVRFGHAAPMPMSMRRDVSSVLFK